MQKAADAEAAEVAEREEVQKQKELEMYGYCCHPDKKLYKEDIDIAAVREEFPEFVCCNPQFPKNTGYCKMHRNLDDNDLNIEMKNERNTFNTTVQGVMKKGISYEDAVREYLTNKRDRTAAGDRRMVANRSPSIASD